MDLQNSMYALYVYPSTFPVENCIELLVYNPLVGVQRRIMLHYDL